MSGVSMRLHYIFDPYCGWCYAISPLIAAARAAGVEVVLHGGGMLSGQARLAVSPALRDYVLSHDERIASLTGLPFGEAYREGLLKDQSVTFDSTPPIAAILAVEALQGDPVAYLGALQRAHYVRGASISALSTLTDLAVRAGLAPVAFERAHAEAMLGPVAQHVAESRAYLQAVGGQGFPCLVLSQGDTAQRFDPMPWLGNPDGFVAALVELVPEAAPTSTVCDLNGACT